MKSALSYLSLLFIFSTCSSSAPTQDTKVSIENNAGINQSKDSPELRNSIRPFIRVARKPVRDLKPAADRFSEATPRLTSLGNKLNKLFNMAAYNPNGAEAPGTPNRDEGYLYWIGWLSHTGNSAFAAQDAHGVYRKVYLTLSCQAATALLASSPLAPLITGINRLFEPGQPFAGGC